MTVETIVGDPKRSIVAAVFHTAEAANAAVERVLEHGYAVEDLSLVMAEATHRKFHAPENLHVHVEAEGVTAVAASAGIGTLAGLAAGTAVGTVAALATVTLPGLGLLLVGPALGGLAGALTGGLVGGMTGLMETDEKGLTYEKVLREGGVLVAVAVHPGEEELVSDIFKDLRGEAVHITGRETHEQLRHPVS